MAPVPNLYVKCPATGKDISTRIEMDRDALKAADLSPAPVRCPYCEKDHTWYKSDLFFKPTRTTA